MQTGLRWILIILLLDTSDEGVRTTFFSLCRTLYLGSDVGPCLQQVLEELGAGGGGLLDLVEQVSEWSELGVQPSAAGLSELFGLIRSKDMHKRYIFKKITQLDGNVNKIFAFSPPPPHLGNSSVLVNSVKFVMLLAQSNLIS